MVRAIAKDGPGVRFIRLAIINLAGVPSIVFGLFGFGLFVIFLDWNVSLISGWFTLADPEGNEFCVLCPLP